MHGAFAEGIRTAAFAPDEVISAQRPGPGAWCTRDCLREAPPRARCPDLQASPTWSHPSPCRVLNCRSAPTRSSGETRHRDRPRRWRQCRAGKSVEEDGSRVRRRDQGDEPISTWSGRPVSRARWRGRRDRRPRVRSSPGPVLRQAWRRRPSPRSTNQVHWRFLAPDGRPRPPRRTGADLVPGSQVASGSNPGRHAVYNPVRGDLQYPSRGREDGRSGFGVGASGKTGSSSPPASKRSQSFDRRGGIELVGELLGSAGRNEPNHAREITTFLEVPSRLPGRHPAQCQDLPRKAGGLGVSPSLVRVLVTETPGGRGLRYSTFPGTSDTTTAFGEA